MARHGVYLLLSFLFQIVFIPSCLCGRCPPSWDEVDQSCYYLLTDTAMNGTIAAHSCREKGGALAVPGSQAEQDTIWALIQNASLTTDVYIGCRTPDGYNDMVCREHDGKVRSYRYWAPNEPTSTQSDTGRCVRINLTAGKWKDIPCHREFNNAMCETSQLPDDTKMPLTCLTADANGRFN